MSHHSSGSGVTQKVTQWFMDNYESHEASLLSRLTLYKQYCHFCAEVSVEHVNVASFGKLIRSLFPDLKTRRHGTRGNSNYYYYGIRIKPSSYLNQVQHAALNLDDGSNSSEETISTKRDDKSKKKRKRVSPGRSNVSHKTFTGCALDVCTQAPASKFVLETTVWELVTLHDGITLTTQYAYDELGLLAQNLQTEESIIEIREKKYSNNILYFELRLNLKSSEPQQRYMYTFHNKDGTVSRIKASSRSDGDLDTQLNNIMGNDLLQNLLDETVDIFYHTNGMLKLKKVWRNLRPILTEIYDKDGKLTSRRTFKNGIIEPKYVAHISNMVSVEQFQLQALTAYLSNKGQ